MVSIEYGKLFTLINVDVYFFVTIALYLFFRTSTEYIYEPTSFDKEAESPAASFLDYAVLVPSIDPVITASKSIIAAGTVI